MNRNSKEAVHK